MPNGQNHLFLSRDFKGHETVQFFFRPVLGKESRTENNNTEMGQQESFVNLSFKTISKLEREFVIPNAEANANKGFCQWTRNVLLVFECVTYKQAFTVCSHNN